MIHNIAAAKFFKYVINVNSFEYESFRESFSKKRLLVDANEWKLAFYEEFRSDFFPLSNLFATLLAFCYTFIPIDIWEGHREEFIVDIGNIKNI